MTRLALLIMLLAADVQAADRSCVAPGGTITLIRASQHQSDWLLKLSRKTFYHVMAESQDRYAWFTCAAAWDTAFTWPQGLTMVATMKDGSEREATFLYVLTPRPSLVPNRLGTYNARVDPADIEHRVWDGGNDVVLYAGFPDPSMEYREVAQISVRRRAP